MIETGDGDGGSILAKLRQSPLRLSQAPTRPLPLPLPRPSSSPLSPQARIQPVFASNTVQKFIALLIVAVTTPARAAAPREARARSRVRAAPLRLRVALGPFKSVTKSFSPPRGL